MATKPSLSIDNISLFKSPPRRGIYDVATPGKPYRSNDFCRRAEWGLSMGVSLCLHLLLLGAVAAWHEYPREAILVNLSQGSRFRINIVERIEQAPAALITAAPQTPAVEPGEKHPADGNLPASDLPMLVADPPTLVTDQPTLVTNPPTASSGSAQNLISTIPDKKAIGPKININNSEKRQLTKNPTNVPTRATTASGPVTPPKPLNSSIITPTKQISGSLPPASKDGKDKATLSSSAAAIKTVNSSPVSAIDPAEQRYVGEQFAFIRTRVLKHLVYPPLARRQGWTGQISAEFTVIANGQIENLRITTSSGRSLLDRQALKAIQAAAPFPAPPVPAHISLPIVFALDTARH